MIKEAIEKITELAIVSQFTINNRKYTSKGIVPVKMPIPTILKVHTLSGLVDYLSKDIDKLSAENIVLHVVSPIEVNLLGYLAADSFFERPEFISAVFEPPTIQCGQYTSLESFIIGLQAFFAPTETNAALLKVVGNIKGEQVQQFADDGMTQAVTAKAGISTVATVPVPNPVKLKPYRTFPEIDQPESLFVFRMKQQDGQSPACGLWEADNKQWKIEAIKSIATWLQEKLPDIPIIA
jgi:hypothetical protein